jgi:hypothetical protein
MRGLRRLHNEQLVYVHVNFRVNKLRRMRWAEHIPCMGQMRNVYKMLV